MIRSKLSYVFLVILTLLSFTSCRNRTKLVTVTETETVVVERVDTAFVLQGDSIRDVKPLAPIGFAKGFTHTVNHELATVVITFDAEAEELVTDVVVHDRDVDIEMERTTTTTEKKKERIVTVEKPSIRGLWWKIPFLCIAFFFIGYGASIMRNSARIS